MSSTVARTLTPSAALTTCGALINTRGTDVETVQMVLYRPCRGKTPLSAYYHPLVANRSDGSILSDD
ncbi:MAG: hypothetical protein ACRDBM_16230 [Sporomusa sp.]